ncbi:hypothetical protein TCDM_05763 [Trypanosoma cruzi Dm28c]|uniref:Uncharacterized protein n=2 Tax=Trypanosoma cruzi TaxID=5693 RepID=V5AY36_TRYCR|nr:hypothetical protein TCDM_05763 [Trypanosoma cruzi Dm28c]PBJ77297.1 hypothetical protein BCY84_06807 [Trypanosoma cruzi cruzi]PWV01148.1 hypothetical protein C4B63_5g416 [Trypanosoma cruzi]PWV03119.1 hypothetical protein C4B63_1g73 [Trypanosoma cruzi]
MSYDGRELSPMAERPVNTAAAVSGKEARSVSGSALPVYDLDPTTRQLLEENEAMLYRINVLTHDVQLAQGEIQKLNNNIAEKNEELEALREKLGDANIHAQDASGRVINYKTECERLSAENKRILKEYEDVCAELEQRTEDIRQNTGVMRPDSVRGSQALSVEQFNREMLSLFPTVDRVVNSLKRCVVVDVTNRERVLDSAQKELSSMQRLADSVRRMGVGEEGRVNNIVSSIRKGEKVQSHGDLAIMIRWMIVQAFESGLTATEGNLRAIETLLAKKDEKTNGIEKNDAGEKSALPSAAGAVRRMFLRPTK